MQMSISPFKAFEKCPSTVVIDEDGIPNHVLIDSAATVMGKQNGNIMPDRPNNKDGTQTNGGGKILTEIRPTKIMKSIK